MYAIIRTGGKQYRVKAGDTVKVEKLNRELGTEFDVEEVLCVGADSKTFVGEPLVANAKVKVVVTQQAKLPKVIVFKKKRRQGYRRLQGHRQLFTELFIKEITSPEGESSKTDKNAQVIDPAKKAERLALLKEAKTTAKKVAKSEGKKVQIKKKAPAKKKASKQVVAKKKAVKKAVKKAAAKRKATAKKKTTQKAVKKTATKKTNTKKKTKTKS